MRFSWEARKETRAIRQEMKRMKTKRRKILKVLDHCQMKFSQAD